MDGSRVRKEKVADSKISGNVWTGPKDHAEPVKASMYAFSDVFSSI